MPKFRKRPVVIEAQQYDGTLESIAGILAASKQTEVGQDLIDPDLIIAHARGRDARRGRRLGDLRHARRTVPREERDFLRQLRAGGVSPMPQADKPAAPTPGPWTFGQAHGAGAEAA